MGHSPIDLHTHDMLVFFLSLVVGPEMAPPVHVYFSLPVLYKKNNRDGSISSCHLKPNIKVGWIQPYNLFLSCSRDDRILILNS